MQIESPFDMMAETYDLDFTWSKIGGLQRGKVRELLFPFFDEGRKDAAILEMNCGTGEDAVWLSRLGHRVVATDASAKMIEKASEKKYRSGIADDRLQIVQCAFQDLAQRFQGGKFDWVFSNFGGINCLQAGEIGKLAANLNGLLVPDGMIALVVMSRFCLWETAYYTFLGQWKTAVRRSRRDQSLVVGGYSLPFYHYSPREMKKIFHPHFTCIGCFPVGLLIPPSYLEQHFSTKPSLLNALDRWESRLNHYQLLSRWADHYCILFKKTKS
jgi:ubiquinone/menaquinone biosynthesis C-methylase UbiE